ncbi:MAG: hypothetical protein HOM14_06725 [Gammaproteobacteria bacterium]|jgi:hypothetical protein|nr:hypothetical protein [Gammaproteobacteria bacterium]MBT4087584.1 hypothetical protein [Deltaproteobacteria bacterium]MBT3725408.1 hypothetical protein [Gammaproteobacteria bacterium]MBT4193979.1 hypothetical protein [Gammaproteobacteria bacterium]MBT4448356.1 hypothetical protein [Gammaproteobacteria bacterium]
MTTRKTTIKKPLKKATTKNPQSKSEPDMQVLAVCTTKSVSGSSTLKYQISIDTKSDIHIRVISSSGTGFVNPSYYPLNDILNILVSHPADAPFSSSLLANGLELEGRSNNNAAFITAVLLQEKILVPFGGQDKFKWKYNSADELLDHIEKLKAKKPTNKSA